MRQVVIEDIRLSFPNTFGVGESSSQVVADERRRLLKTMLELYFDGLLPNMLRQFMFVKLYMASFPSLEVGGGQEAVPFLEEIAAGNTGAFFFGDAAYLKLANNIDRKCGDEMLGLIADGIKGASFSLYGRFREGDEFVACHDSVEVGVRNVEEISRELATHKISDGLPMAIDFGHAEHCEVATTYLRLLQEGWSPEPGRTAAQVFFDIALRIAETRSSVRKVYSRAWLLYYYLADVFAPNPEVTMDDYVAFVDKLTRGGKFVIPHESWLSMTDSARSEVIRLEALALLSPASDAGHFDRVVIEVAESIYFNM